MPYQTADGVSSFVPGQFVKFDVPEGYKFVRKYPMLPCDLLPVKGFLLRTVMDGIDMAEELEMC
jgi:hypothetical protein